MIVPDVLAKVVINERTGTVVMGENICIMPVAISHKNIYLVVKGEEKKEIEEETEKEKEGKVKETEEEREIVGPMLPAIPPVDTSIIAEALNAIKVPPEQIGTAIEIIRKKYEDKMKAERVGVSPTVAEEKSKIGTPEKEKGVEVQGNMVFFPTKVRVGDIVKGLNAVGATPQDIIAVLQAIKAAGALYAELVIM
jgi:flagellar basal body P-ring protein FlgI